MKKTIKTAVCAALILAAMLAGCAADPQKDRSQNNLNDNDQSQLSDQEPSSSNSPKTVTENLTSQMERHEINQEIISPTGTVAATDFGLNLLRQSMKEGENTLVSPFSVLCALGMTANGADGETLAQMEEVFGLTADELNQYLYAYTNALPQGEKYKLTPANAIWFRDREDLKFQEDFLQTSADWYNAGIFRAPFDDSTRREINEWVEEHTDGMIRNMLEEGIRGNSVMYLVNALAFDAEWETIYEDRQVRNGAFTTAGGNEQEVEFMYSEEYCYLEDENAVGFVKYYADKSYAFAALLPNEGLSLADYVASLTGAQLNHLLSNAQDTSVYVAIPKFQCEYSTGLSDVLKSMGMTDAFDISLADFTRLGSSGEGPLFIGQVLHKTYLAVDEKGTKAGAATVVDIRDGGAMMIDREVYLNRPFVYMLIDCRENLPVFIGTLEQIDP